MKVYGSLEKRPNIVLALLLALKETFLKHIDFISKNQQRWEEGLNLR